MPPPDQQGARQLLQDIHAYVATTVIEAEEGHAVDVATLTARLTGFVDALAYALEDVLDKLDAATGSEPRSSER